MAKKQKIIIFLSALPLVLALYLVLTSESIRPENQAGAPASQTNLPRLEDDYKREAAELFFRFEDYIKRNDFTAENTAELKDRALSLKVPAKFKKLHLKFVLALTEMENYLSTSAEPEKIASLEAVNQLKADYSWLNN